MSTTFLSEMDDNAPCIMCMDYSSYDGMNYCKRNCEEYQSWMRCVMALEQDMAENDCFGCPDCPKAEALEREEDR